MIRLKSLQLGVDLRGLCLGEGGARLVDGRLVGCLLDPKQQVAFLDLLPFGEVALLDESRHPRNDVDLVDRRDAADVASLPGVLVRRNISTSSIRLKKHPKKKSIEHCF
jgi:hypothetical protein